MSSRCAPIIGGLLLTMIPLFTGCSSNTTELAWNIVFAEEDDRLRAAAIEASILDGGCTSPDVLYRAVVFPDQQVPTPPSLRSGRFGFLAIAGDATCIWYAYGCTDVELPRSNASTTVNIENPLYEVQCPPEECVAGACRDDADGGPGDADIDDADTDGDGDGDAGTDATADSG